MKVAVTGATGFIGSHILTELHEHGHEVTAVAVGAPGAVPGSDDEARARLGDYFAEVLLFDQGTAAARAGPNSAGIHPIHHLPTSSATGGTANDRHGWALWLSAGVRAWADR